MLVENLRRRQRLANNKEDILAKPNQTLITLDYRVKTAVISAKVK